MLKLHLLFICSCITAAALFNKQQQLHENSRSSELRLNCCNYFPHKERAYLTRFLSYLGGQKPQSQNEETIDLRTLFERQLAKIVDSRGFRLS